MFQPLNLLLLAAAFLYQIQHYCNATDCASSCGNIRINYPFRLKTDPSHCGHKYYELACKDSAVILYLSGELKGAAVGYPVRAINYNMTIRLANPNIQMDNCALPNVTNVSTYAYSSHFYSTGYENRYYPQNLYRILCFVSCPNPMAGSVEHVDNSRCNLKRYWYLQVCDDYFQFRASELENWCRIV